MSGFPTKAERRKKKEFDYSASADTVLYSTPGYGHKNWSYSDDISDTLCFSVKEQQKTEVLLAPSKCTVGF